MTDYLKWRVTFQSAEQAVRGAFEEMEKHKAHAEALQAKLDSINGISTRCDKTVDMFIGDERIEG